MDYLKENAITFEDVRIGAAAVEAWGVKDCPFDLKPWFKIADKDGTEIESRISPRGWYARDVEASHAAFSFGRLGSGGRSNRDSSDSLRRSSCEGAA